MEIEKYFDEGYCIVKNFVSTASAQELHNKIYNYTKWNGNINEIFTYPDSLIRFFDPRIYTRHKFKIEGFNLGLYLLIAKNNNKMKVIKKILNLKKCNRIDSYFSDISNDEIIQWHCDQSFGGATDPGLYFNGNKENISINGTNKFFLHLTAVEKGNGAFSYLPRSHIIGIAIRKIINSGKLKYEPFMNLTDAYSIINKNYQLFINNGLLKKEEIDYFIDNAEKALNNIYDFSLNIDAGGMIIFNDLGFHQGTAPSKSQRLVVRYFY